ncbi:MAG: HNH endonuclease [Saprospiraceae bacterium]|nr:HNH endonuclease [Saprospiraceae bacterium]
MQNPNLEFYIYAFTHLRRDNHKGGAPHKPILLLSLIDAFANNLIPDNKIYITPELIGFFKINWANYVEDEREKRFALPFYHMKSEKFWRLIPKSGYEVWIELKDSMRSLGNLQVAVDYAEIDIVLVELLKKPVERKVLKQALLDIYFPNATLKTNSYEGLDLIHNIENQLLNEDSATYSAEIKELKSKLNKVEFEEEVILRGSLFKREVPKKYKFTCCVSRLSVDVTFNSTTLIEACHIEPFSVSYIDTISNGLALSPTLHAAFDRGLFTISDEYKVIVSKKFKESKSPHGLQQFNGQQILLPDLTLHFPDLERLAWHRKYKFEK